MRFDLMLSPDFSVPNRRWILRAALVSCLETGVLAWQLPIAGGAIVLKNMLA
jgi:hypothetical protein